MPKKYTYEEVKEYIEKQNCQLLEDTYINGTTKMKMLCSCGEEMKKDFLHFKKGQFFCKKCINNNKSEKYRTDIEEVKNFISSKGCIFLEGEYKNSLTKLKIQCKCGNIFLRDFSHFKRGQYYCVDCSKKTLSNKKIIYTKEKAEELISKRGYSFTEDSIYVNAATPVKCRCEKNHEFNLILSQFLQGCSGCRICSYEKIKGENHWNYKGGNSEVLDKARKSLVKWKKEVMERDEYKCFLTGQTDFVIHHLKSFNTICEEASLNINIPILKKLSDYEDQEDAYLLIDKIIEMHEENNGIVISRDIHQKFHSEYGLGNNTKDQFLDFIKKYYPEKEKDFLKTFS